MNDAIEQLGLGVLVAYGALPLLLWTVRDLRSREPSSRQRALVWVLGLDAALIAVPLIRSWLSMRPGFAALPALDLSSGVSAAQALPIFTSVARESVAPLKLIAALWVAMVALGLLLGAVRAWRLRRLRARAVSPSPQRLAQIDRAARQCGIRPPYAACSSEVELPFVTGLLRPVLVLPERLMSSLDEEASRLVLHHEVLHLARLDHWQAALVSALRALFPLHPAARSLTAQYALAREEAVDAEVAPMGPAAYAHLLVDAASLRHFDPADPRVAMSGSDLSHRIHRLTHRVPLRRARLAITAAAFGAIALAMFAAPKVDAQSSAGGQVTEVLSSQPDGSQQRQGEVIELPVGARRTIAQEHMARVAIGDASIADLTVDLNKLTVRGLAAGTTSLLIWLNGGERISHEVRVSNGGASQSLPYTLNSADIMQAIIARKAQIEGCVKAFKSVHPRSIGTLTLEWTIEPDGHVDRIGQRDNGKPEEEELFACLARVVSNCDFPRHALPQPISFPFKY